MPQSLQKQPSHPQAMLLEQNEQEHTINLEIIADKSRSRQNSQIKSTPSKFERLKGKPLTSNGGARCVQMQVGNHLSGGSHGFSGYINRKNTD